LTSTHGAPARQVHGGQAIGNTATTTPKTSTTRVVPVVASTAHPTTVVKVVPSLEEIGFRTGATVETNDKNTHFSPWSDAVTVRDGTGGGLTAIVGVRFPTADGYGQVVFFWHNTTFVGLDSSTESVQVKSLNAPSAGVFVVTYARYALSDPLCCPSLPPRPIEYRWNGPRLVPSGVPPVEPGTHPVTVTTTP